MKNNIQQLVCDRCGRIYLYDSKDRKGHSKKNCNTCITLLRRNKLKKKLIELKGGKCKICGYEKCIASLCFHHRDKTEKEFVLSRNFNKSWEKIKKEAEKCDLLCANCHTELHYNMGV